MRLVLYLLISGVCQTIPLSIPIGFRRVIFNWVIRRVFVWHFQYNLQPSDSVVAYFVQ